jgi:hypothetical protein
VDAAGRVLGAEHLNRTLDLPPTAEVQQIADGAAFLGARRRFELGMVTESIDEIGRFGERRAIGMNWMLQEPGPYVERLASGSPFQNGALAS